MFKIGDIVKLNKSGCDVYKTKMYIQSYKVIYSSIEIVKVRGIMNKIEICYSNRILDYDYDYMRRKKIDKICSKMEIK